jgi:hypothetical protein
MKFYIILNFSDTSSCWGTVAEFMVKERTKHSAG